MNQILWKQREDNDQNKNGLTNLNVRFVQGPR